MSSNEPIQTKIVIIGAGFGGLGMGAALKRAGEDDFMILEKGSTVGGVWRDNHYPGCTCDVPSHLYSFSFAPYKGRDKRFPPQREILVYLQQVAYDQGLLPHLNLKTEVSTAHFREDANDWEIMTACKQCIYAGVIIFAVGQLHRPYYPKLPGLDNFCGPVLHPAQWDNSINFHGKRISVIGTGSSAVQMLPTLASAATKVTVYQRTPHWVLPKLGSDFGHIARAFLRLPGAHGVYRKALHHGADIFLSPISRSKAWRTIVEGYARRNLRSQITDEGLFRKLLPEYPLASKRILFDNDFYPTLVRPNVHLITEPIKLISERGIETGSEILETDIIICATGFRASEFLVPISVCGRDGRSLNEDWKAGAEAFMGLAIHGYPNLFMIAGPNSFNPAGSNPEMKELQIAYIMRCLRWKKEGNAQAIEVKEESALEYGKWLERKVKQSVWQDSVDSWYKHESGKVTNPWPESVRVFARLLRKAPASSFAFVSLESAAAQSSSHRH